jgi:CheY-like chemotaxis protein
MSAPIAKDDDDSPSVSTRSLRVVVAEDNPDMRTLVADGLRADGYDVTELASGAALLIFIARTYRSKEHDGVEAPDLIVSDVRMPVMSGLQIVRGIRDANWTTPVILMTAFGDAQTRREAEALDAVLLDKPLRMADLRAEVHRLLETRLTAP